MFSRFDALCDKHNVQKLETIGDAYICTAGLVQQVDVKDAARRVLSLAKDMIRETRKVFIDRGRRKEGRESPSLENPQIRVGIHVGNLTCGVLGQRLPKFTVFGEKAGFNFMTIYNANRIILLTLPAIIHLFSGSTVNMAARMEQTSFPSKIRVTEDFYDLVSDNFENIWSERSVITVKNMGEVGTYVLSVL